MGSGLFWGILLMVLGVSLIIKVVFNIHVPIFRIVLAFILIYLGLRILFGNIKSDDNKNDIIFSEARITEIDRMNREYNVIFGKSTFDFTNIEFQYEKPVDVEVNSIFGGSVIQISKDVPVLIKGETVFANLKLPNGNTSFFGDLEYRSDNFDEAKPYLFIKASAVFGSIEIYK